MVDNPGEIKLTTDRLFFTYKDFASIVGVHEVSVARWARAGYLKVARFSPRCVMIPRAELERYLRGEMMAPRKEEKNEKEAVDVQGDKALLSGA